MAVKSMNKSKFKNKLEELINEVEILSRTDHPNVVTLYEYFDEEFFFHIVTEYCSGGELFDRIEQNGRLTEAEVIIYMKDMVSAVSHLHKLGICHRDLKPQNFVFENSKVDAKLKLIDFGLAQKFIHKKASQAGMNTFAGTAHFIAPEVIKATYDLKCDMWSLGIIMDLMLTGDYPFTGRIIEEIYSNILNQEYSTVGSKYLNISRLGRNLLKKLLTKDPILRLSAEQTLDHPWMHQIIEEPADLDIIRRLQQFKPPSQMWKAAMAIMVKYLSVDEIKSLRATFIEIDTRKTGMLSLDDIKIALERSGIVLAKREVQEVFKRLDFACDGIIHYSEFLAATVSNCVEIDQLMMCTLFNYFDVDRSGEITVENLRIVFKNMGLVCSDEKIIKIIKEVDINKSGSITFEEFKILMEQKAVV